jgi:hypothetical protein
LEIAMNDWTEYEEMERGDETPYLENAMTDIEHRDAMEPAAFKAGLDRRGANRKALMEWLREALVDGVDYGAVPLRRGGFSKPSLRKPGAEKICGMLGVTATFPTLKDYERAALEGRDVFHIVLRCHLLNGAGDIVADGVGARSLEADHGDLNKAFKMAEKSAHIDATLRMAGLSEIFTQDLEDMPAVDESPKPSAKDYVTTERFATPKQVQLLRVKLDQAGIPENEFLRKFEIDAVEKLPFSKVNPALHWMAGVAA